MNIALFSETNMLVGGGFQQAFNVILFLTNHFKEQHSFVVYTTQKENFQIFRKNQLPVKLLRFNVFDNLLFKFRYNNFIGRKLINSKYFKYNPFDKILNQDDIDLLIFLGPSNLILKTELHNFVVYVWDLSHRDTPEFPEVSKNNVFESREHVFQKCLSKATAVLVDSELGKSNIIRRYNIENERVYVLKYLPGNFVHINDEDYNQNYIDIKKKYKIKNDYIFYPAQFWAHKNHVYIIDALEILKNKYDLNIDVVFTGSDKGNLNSVLHYAKQRKVLEQVNYLGFVHDEEMPYLYKQSIALVMPTYFGPTNLPPLEAFSLEVPVLYSDIPEYIESLGKAVLPIKLDEPISLANSIIQLLSDVDLKKSLILHGQKYLESWTELDYKFVFEEIINKYRIKLKCWKVVSIN